MTEEVVVWLVKYAHMAGIAIWAGGLLTLPLLLPQRNGLTGDALDRLHRMMRFLHVALISPAAYLAVATGIALVFLRETWVEWFSAKLAFVGLLVLMHVTTGFAIISTFEPDGKRGRLGSAALSLGSLIAVIGILFFVLGKPEIGTQELAAGLFRPGGLGAAIGSAVEPIIDAVRP